MKTSRWRPRGRAATFRSRGSVTAAAAKKKKIAPMPPHLLLLLSFFFSCSAFPWPDAAPPPPASSSVPPYLSLHTVPQALADAHGAKCLDGTPPAMYVLPQDPLRWIIFVEGGGWCFSVSSCVGRAASSGGSSRGLSPTMDVGGLLSPSPTINPRFFNWTMVFLHYCDGSSHVSWRARPRARAVGARRPHHTHRAPQRTRPPPPPDEQRHKRHRCARQNYLAPRAAQPRRGL